MAETTTTTTTTETKEETKKQLTPKQIFAIRMVCWVLCALIIPVAFIIFRYDLFTKISKVQFGGWGMIAILIIFTFVIVLGNYLKGGFKKYSMVGQIINGAVKVVLPLVALYFILVNIKDSIDLFLQALAVVIISETIAIPINPMPKWVYEQSKGEAQDTIDYFFKKYDERKETKDN